MLNHFGRIALGGIVNRWSDSHPSNPRFLAAEVAATLRSLAAPTHPIGPMNAGVYHDGQATRDQTASITHGALADYFDSVSSGQPAATIRTNVGEFPVANVLIWQHWIDLVTVETARRMGNVEVLALSANSSASVVLAVNYPAPAITHLQPVDPPSGSTPGYLKMYQTKLRKEGEQSAAENLDAEKAARQRLEREVAKLNDQLAIKDIQITQLQEENEQLRRSENEALRTKREVEDENLVFEERLEDVMAFAECLRPDNPLSPPELALAFQCWRDLTQEGTQNPASAGGRGVHPLVNAWLERSGHRLNKTETERLCAVVSWRKRGSGAIRSH